MFILRPLSQAPTGVKLLEQAARILLVASHARHESPLLDAVREETGVRSGSRSLEFANWHLEHIADFLVVPDILDRTRAGCVFMSVYLTLHAATWSRARHCEQPPRSRVEPRGVSHMDRHGVVQYFGF